MNSASVDHDQYSTPESENKFSLDYLKNYAALTFTRRNGVEFHAVRTSPRRGTIRQIVGLMGEERRGESSTDFHRLKTAFMHVPYDTCYSKNASDQVELVFRWKEQG